MEMCKAEVNDVNTQPNVASLSGGGIEHVHDDGSNVVPGVQTEEVPTQVDTEAEVVVDIKDQSDCYIPENHEEVSICMHAYSYIYVHMLAVYSTSYQGSQERRGSEGGSLPWAPGYTHKCIKYEPLLSQALKYLLVTLLVS